MPFLKENVYSSIEYIFFVILSETAFHPRVDMEQFELEMYERHKEFFKQVKSMSIDTWCEKSRDTASRDVKRVRILH